MIEKFKEAVDKGDKICSTLNLSKAFDSNDYYFFFFENYTYMGIQFLSVDILSSYLRNRTQQI